MLWGQNSDSVKRSFFAKPILSAEIYAFYPYYFIEYSDFNYGFGGAITAQLKRAKYTLGFNYSTKNYSEKFNSSFGAYYYFDKIDFKTIYYNIPFLISFPLFNKDYKKKNDFIIGAGIIWNIPRKYEAFIIYKHTLPYPNPYIITDLGVGQSFQLLLRYQRRINKTFDIYFSGFCCYKTRLEYTNYHSPMAPWSPEFSEGRFLIGVNIGIEWFYKR
jgi:hypothetical protein